MILCSPAKAQDLVILHTNDVHSQITPQLTPRLIGDGIGLGGYERRENYIKQVIKKHGKNNVLILDGGDFSMGSSHYAIYKGDVEIELFNVLGYDAVCLGNHEFDRGQQELAHRVGNAKFDVLCANYDFSESPLNGLVKPSKNPAINATTAPIPTNNPTLIPPPPFNSFNSSSVITTIKFSFLFL